MRHDMKNLSLFGVEYCSENKMKTLLIVLFLAPMPPQNLMIVKWDLPIVCPQPVGGPCGPLSKT
jgi:hypothetical protein